MLLSFLDRIKIQKVSTFRSTIILAENVPKVKGPPQAKARAFKITRKYIKSRLFMCVNKSKLYTMRRLEEGSLISTRLILNYSNQN